MKRLSGLDASFLYLETPSSYMHVAGLMILDPATALVQWSFDEVRDMYAARLHLAPPFRRRLVEVPFGVHHPVWIEDPDFDLDFHLHHMALPGPGACASSDLGRSSPGRSTGESPSGSQPQPQHGHMVSRRPTTAIDGVSGNEMTVAMLDVEPEGRTSVLTSGARARARGRVAGVREDRSDPARSRGSPLARADGANLLPEPFLRHAPPAPFTAPRTSWNHALSPHRSYAMTTLSLDDAKVVKREFGTTLNDVVMAMCAGSLRSYLDGRGERVAQDLVAMVPMSVRGDDQSGTGGNRISSMLASLATTIDDPVERLRAISAG
jgi:hypothetical protein